MPDVTGNVRNLLGGLMDIRDVTIRFTLNQGNIRPATSRMYPDMFMDITPDPATGEFTVGLQQTTDQALDAWYRVDIIYQESPSSTNANGMTMISYLDLKIRVPASGGEIGQLIDYTAGGPGQGGPNNRVVWVSQSPPPKPRPFMLWLKQEPGDSPDPFDPRNTGVLYEWRN